MGDGSYVQQVVLKSARELDSGDRPTVSLSLTVRDSGESALRLLDDVGPYVDEVVVVVADAGRDVASSLRGHRALRGGVGSVVAVDRDSFPSMYMLDVPETYAAGRPLDGESYGGPFTGKYVVSDWAGARNLGLCRCTQEWRLVLDGDDVLLGPDYVAGACDAMRRFGRDLGYSTYVRPVDDICGRPPAATLAGRLAENCPRVRWEGAACEAVEGGQRTAILDGSLVAVRSRFKAGAEAEARDVFRVLYARARRRDWKVPPCDLLYMARAARHVGMADFAAAAVSAYLDESLYTEERAWACALMGEALESRGDYGGAASWYERSLAEHLGYKSAFRLCRARFMQREWRASVDAYERGVASRGVVHLVDDGALDERKSLVFVAAALGELGRREEARERGAALRTLFPGSAGVSRLCEHLLEA